MRHECLVNSMTATSDEMAGCYKTRPHMEFYCGNWTLRYPDGKRIWRHSDKEIKTHGQ